MSTRETRLKTYSELADNLKLLYDDPSSGSLMYSVFQKHGLAEETYPIYGNLVGDTILGFYKTTDLPRLFQSELGMSADEAQKMMSELIEFLTPVIKREEETNNIKKEDLDRLAKTFETSNQNRQKEIVPEGKPTDVQPLRTMAGDMSRVHGYGAYRDQNPINDDEPVVSSASQNDLLSPNVPPPATVLDDDLQAPDPDVGQIPIKRAE